MRRNRVSRLSLAAAGLFLVAGASLALIGLRLVASERAVAERAARESLRARLGEASGLLLSAAARLSRAEPVAVLSPEGVFLTPPEPLPLEPLAVVPGRDPEADFYLAEGERAETAAGEPERAKSLYLAAAAEGRDPTARLIALHRLAALAMRQEEPEEARKYEARFRALLPDGQRTSLEALLVRAGADRPDPELRGDLLRHLGAGDDEVVLGLLRRAGVYDEAAVAARRAEIETMARLRGLRATTVAAGRITLRIEDPDGTVRFAEGPAPALPEGVTLADAAPGSLVETLEPGEPFPGARLTAALPHAEVAAAARRGAGMLIAALAALLAAGAAALLLTLRASRRESAAARERARFLTRVGHDLRTPLTLIRMYAETIAAGRVSDPGEARDFAAIAAREAERLTGIVGDALDLSRVSAGNGALARVRLDLGELAAEVAEAHRPLLKREGLELVVESAGPVPVRADPSALRGAVSNLIANVLRHAAEGGTVEIRATAEEDTACLTVSDRGPGFPAGLTERVFERFVRGPDRGERGAGLGLALVREVAAAHGGRATAANREGGGAVLTITMPIDAGTDE